MVKILFVCRANVGRSQMAEAIFNKLSKTNEAISAGINPPSEWLGKKLKETNYVKVCMKEIACDVEEKISKKLTEEMTDSSDLIVLMVEKNTWPKYLENYKTIYWPIEDPDGSGLEEHRMVRDQILDLINEQLSNYL